MDKDKTLSRVLAYLKSGVNEGGLSHIRPHEAEALLSMAEENKRLREALDRIYIAAASPHSAENQYHMGKIAIEALTDHSVDTNDKIGGDE